MSASFSSSLNPIITDLGAPLSIQTLDVLILRSTVKPDTLSPVWNELWKIRNVPNTATLHVEVLDKDVGNITDDHIGTFSTPVTDGAKELTIESASIRRNRGTFWLQVGYTLAPSSRVLHLRFN